MKIFKASEDYVFAKSFVTVGVPTGPQEASLRFLTASEEGDFFKGFNSIQGHLFSMRMLKPQLVL